MIQNSLDSVKKSFVKYLDSLGISAKSHKNYRSDLNHFSGWAILKIRSFGSYVESLSDTVPFLSNKLISEYVEYLTENKIPSKTINRRLSTLRHLSRFLYSQGDVDANFMDGIENINTNSGKKTSAIPLVENYRSYLEAEKVSKSTIKNYTSDVRQFLSWLEAQEQNLTEAKS